MRERVQAKQKGDQVLQARVLAEERLAQCDKGEINRWTEDAQEEAKEKRIPRFALDSFIRSRLLVRVAEKYAITGL